jgi:hypothetical protein
MAESFCKRLHITIEEAIVCAEKSLGSFRKPADPYWGTMKDNSSLVVGFQLSPRKRWRLDFDPDPANAKWVHVNEENFDAPQARRRITHRVDNRSYIQVQLYYQKWTKKYR